ncbi:MAG: hypothetical protein IJU19_06600 [Bacteroidales bacterium]|nr:hypothetical protein [Bacteroidales bacterium]
MHKPTIVATLLLIIHLTANAQQSVDEQAAYYYGRGEYEQAAHLYSDLYRQTDNPYHYQRLLSSYMELGHFGDAIHLAERRLAHHRQELSPYVDIGNIYLLQNKTNKAKKSFNKAIESITSNLQPIPALAQAFANSKQFTYAAQVYTTARQRAHNPTLYFSELIGIYQQAADYTAMVDEYFTLLDLQPTMMQSLQISMQNALIQAPDNQLSDGIRQVLVTRLRQNPQSPTYLEMMLWFSLQEKDFTFALEQAKANDARFPAAKAEQVLRVARIAEQNDSFSIAADAYAYLCRKGEKSPYYTDALIGELEVKFKTIQTSPTPPRKAITSLRDQYLTTIDKLGKTPTTLTLMRHCAHLMAYHLGEVQPAVDLLDDILEMPRLNPHTRDEVKLELGDLLLFVGQPWDASLLYMQVEKANADDALGAMAKLKNARLSYFNHDFTWATSQLRVLRSSTSKLVANDAMQLSLLISDNMEDDSTYTYLAPFADADLLLYRNLLDSAWEAFDRIAHSTLSHPLFDDILMRKAQIRTLQARYTEADSLLSILIENYPDELTTDDALMQRAELNEKHLHRPEVALDCYQRLLIDYPASLHTDLARKQYNNLKTK